jgi:Spy/CpxP family protein refolding chaperone
MIRAIVSSTTLGRLPVGLAIVFALAVGLAACDATSTAEAPPDEALRPGAAAADGLAEAAGLDGEQAASLQDVLDGYRERDPAPGLLWHAARDVRDRLTDEQAARLLESVEDRRQARRNGPGLWADRTLDRRQRMRRGAPWGSIAERLDLTEAQKDALKSVRASVRGDLRALRQTHRAGTFGPDDAERLRKIREEIRSAMKAVLTDAQQARLEEMRAEREQRRQEVRTARAEALDLSDAQAAAFEEVLEDLRDGEPPVGLRARRPALRAVAGEVLTAEQREVVAIHRLLAHRVLKLKRAPGDGPAGR